MIKNLTIGADPELFLERRGEIISAEGLIGGTKYEPKLISDKGHSIQEDNIMAEFNIPPSKDKEEFVNNIEFVKEHLEILAKMHDATLNFSASASLDPKYLKTKQAKEFGCMPDYNVYSKSVNERPKGGGNLRTCGGHIHIGYDNPNQKDSENIILALDATIGLKSLGIDMDDNRRTMYGKAGSFRFKPFGIEYRTLSNFWIANTELIGWAYDQVIEAIQLINDGYIDLIIGYSKEIEEAINTNNRDLAKIMLEKLEKNKVKQLSA